MSEEKTTQLEVVLTETMTRYNLAMVQKIKQILSSGEFGLPKGYPDLDEITAIKNQYKDFKIFRIKLEGAYVNSSSVPTVSFENFKLEDLQFLKNDLFDTTVSPMAIFQIHWLIPDETYGSTFGRIFIAEGYDAIYNSLSLTFNDGWYIYDLSISLESGSVVMSRSDRLANIESKLNSYPVITDAMKKDGKAYAFVNGQFDDICPADKSIVVQPNATAQSLVLDSLAKGVLVTKGADENMIEEMRELLGEEMFNELASKSVATMELRPKLTFEQQLAEAIKDYEERKEMQAQRMLAMAEREKEQNIVEPLNIDKDEQVD